MPRTKPLSVGDVGEHVVGEEHVGPLPLAASRSARAAPKNSSTVLTPFSRATSAMLRAGSMPSTGMPRGHEVLEQVAVVAGGLDDQAFGPRPRRSICSRALCSAWCRSAGETLEK